MRRFCLAILDMMRVGSGWKSRNEPETCRTCDVRHNKNRATSLRGTHTCWSCLGRQITEACSSSSEYITKRQADRNVWNGKEKAPTEEWKLATPPPGCSLSRAASPQTWVHFWCCNTCVCALSSPQYLSADCCLRWRRSFTHDGCVLLTQSKEAFEGLVDRSRVSLPAPQLSCHCIRCSVRSRIS